jgi:ABC-type spermidine/putrescine transport system permease subunit II
MGRYVLPCYFIVIVGYLVVPLALVFPISLSDTNYLAFPPKGLTLRWYVAFFSSPAWRSALQTSLLLAVLTAIIATTLGTLAALAITRVSRSLGGAITGFFLAPQIVPVVIIALGGFLFLNAAGLYGSLAGVLLMHIVLALPFVVVIMTAGLRQAGDSLTRAARILGATPMRALVYVTLPAVTPSLIAGAVFAFFISFDELVVTLFVSGSHVTLPIRIWADVRQELTPVIAAAASILTLMTVLLAAPAELYRRRSA